MLGFYDDATTPVRYQRVPLDATVSRIAGDEATADRVPRSAPRRRSREPRHHGKDSSAVRLGESHGGEVSSAAKVARKCHPAAFDVWKDSGHAHATETLTRLNPPRQFDPECLSCHVTGWDPQQYVPFQTGFCDLTEVAATRRQRLRELPRSRRRSRRRGSRLRSQAPRRDARA